MITYADEYAEMLSCAMKRSIVRTYALSRLDISLKEIGIDTDCVTRITKILIDIFNDECFTSAKLSDLILQFQKDWRPHLYRAYFGDYESIRWNFIVNLVLNKLGSFKNNLGRCLDIGCGRGCITESLVSHGRAASAWGIDVIDFSSEWRERKKVIGTLRLDKVPLQNIGDWLRVSEKFDTVFLFYVLHHSNDYWAARTIREVRQYLKRGGIIVVLEDSLLTDKDPDQENDPYKLTPDWRQWIRNDRPYCLSAGFDVQVILDFVAVQLLAGFREVSMPCNYKLGSDWEKMFDEVGLSVVKKINLGFPKMRDIDVPQAVFILKANGAGENDSEEPNVPTT